MIRTVLIPFIVLVAALMVFLFLAWGRPQEDVPCQIRSEMVAQYSHLLNMCTGEIRIYKEMGEECQAWLEKTRAINKRQTARGPRPKGIHGQGGH